MSFRQWCIHSSSQRCLRGALLPSGNAPPPRIRFWRIVKKSDDRHVQQIRQKHLFWGGVSKRMVTHKKLQPLQCYHIFSDSRDEYLSKNCYEHYSPRMVPVAEISGSGSWPITRGQDYKEKHKLDSKPISNSQC